MLMIRQGQLDALTRERQAALRRWLVDHLRVHFAGELTGWSEARIGALVEAGIARALSHGATRGVTIAKFVHLMVLFGAGFDVDPDLPWAAAILREPSIEDGDVRIAILARAAEEALGAAPERGDGREE